MASKNSLILGGIAVVAIALAIVFVPGAFTTGPKPLEVKFQDFTLSKTTLKPNESTTLTINVINKEKKDVSGVTIDTRIQGTQTLYNIQPKTVTINTPIGPGGTSGPRTITITGVTPADESVTTKFIVDLKVGGNVTETREFTLQLQK